MNFAQRIREKRKALDLTQAQVASYFQISSVSVSEWERGISKPDQSKLETLARLLKTSIGYLLTGKETKNVDHIAPKHENNPPDNLIEISTEENRRSKDFARLDWAGTSYARPQHLKRMQHAADSVFEQIKRELPEELRDNCDRAIGIQGFDVRYDYVSSKLIAFLLEPLPESMRISPDSAQDNKFSRSRGSTLFSNAPWRLWHLAVAKAYFESTEITNLRLSLIVALDLSTLPIPLLTRYHSEARLVGIDLIISDDSSRLANYILSVEQGRPSPFEEDAEEDDHW